MEGFQELTSSTAKVLWVHVARLVRTALWPTLELWPTDWETLSRRSYLRMGDRTWPQEAHWKNMSTNLLEDIMNTHMYIHNTLASNFWHHSYQYIKVRIRQKTTGERRLRKVQSATCQNSLIYSQDQMLRWRLYWLENLSDSVVTISLGTKWQKSLLDDD